MLRAAYVDMDGTLLGRRASLFHDADGAFTLLGARALEACARAEVELVPVLGAAAVDAAAQRGAPGPALVHLRGGLRDGPGRRGRVRSWTRRDDAGANALLLSRYAGRLEMYDPWNRGRESSRLYLGRDVSAAEADELLVEEGFGALRLVDNGLMHGVDGGGRAYHLVPREASKARAVARHMQARGYAPEEVIAVGDSMRGPRRGRRGRHVLARGERDAGGARRRACGAANVRVAEASNGAGVYEAVITELAERR